MREALAHALHSSLEWDDSEHERAIDKVTAFSYSDRLGTMLWRFRDSNDRTVHKTIILLLAKQLEKQLPSQFNRGKVIKIAGQALKEWSLTNCRTCYGSGEIMAGELKVVCRVCGGSGVKRYSDRERERVMGGHHPKHMKYLLDVITWHYSIVSAQMRRRLER